MLELEIHLEEIDFQKRLAEGWTLIHTMIQLVKVFNVLKLQFNTVLKLGYSISNVGLCIFSK